jgi:hypothetical protein
MLRRVTVARADNKGDPDAEDNAIDDIAESLLWDVLWLLCGVKGDDIPDTVEHQTDMARAHLVIHRELMDYSGGHGVDTSGTHPLEDMYAWSYSHFEGLLDAVVNGRVPG